MFKKGDKVICINNELYSPTKGVSILPELELNKEYIISESNNYNQVRVEGLRNEYLYKRFVLSRWDKVKKIKERINLYIYIYKNIFIVLKK